MITGNEIANPEITTEVDYQKLSGNMYPNTYSYGGETILQKWSAMAMQGILASNWNGGSKGVEQGVAEKAVRLAKALIAELNKEV